MPDVKPEPVEALVAWLWSGPRRAVVTEVEVTEEELRPDLAGFGVEGDVLG